MFTPFDFRPSGAINRDIAMVTPLHNTQGNGRTANKSNGRAPTEGWCPAASAVREIAWLDRLIERRYSFSGTLITRHARDP